jgi:two-component system CheB/CheR fusion protein
MYVPLPPHNILSDPPFSRIDFISCCNVLIYFDSALHTKVFKTFRYALNDGGSLMLSRSETIGSSQLFLQDNKKFKIYEPVKGPRVLPDLVYRTPAEVLAKKIAQPYRKTTYANSMLNEDAITSLLMARYIPAYVVINYARKVLQFKGATSNYLEHATGKATLNILTMARPEMSFELRDAINKAIETQQEINKTGIEIKNGLVLNTINLDVVPINSEGMEPLLLVVFAQKEQVEKTKWEESSIEPVQGNVKKLKEELMVVRSELISVTKENEKANRILLEANEEILSSNEEFQSMNEELETSKEEIESANQELITTNQEIQTRNEQLAEANDLSESIVATLHEPILILDKDWHIKSTNKAFCKKFKMRKPDVEGKRLFDLGNRTWDIPRLHELLRNIGEKSDSFYDYEITHDFEGIGKKTLLLNAMHIRQKAQDEQLILLAFTDATERTRESKAQKKELEDIISERTLALKQSFEAMEEKNVSLEKMNKELETFTFISSHDLQEPLRKIKNFTTVILQEESSNLSDTGKNYLQKMQDSVKRMQLLIEDLLVYAQVKDDKQAPEKTEINKIVKEVIADFHESIKEKKSVVTMTGNCKLNLIEFQFRQVIHNLISNSIKFAHAKRPLHIAIKCETKLGIKMSKELLPAVSYCHISVADNGIGFDVKYCDRIFEVFQRLHGYDQYKGTGMGLAICKRIVEQHNGIITATCKLNKGATFDIYIPSA